MTAARILAEIGPDMNQFESAKNLCSWCGICPGNHRSAGKSKHSHIKKGNKFLLAALAEAGWGAARKSGSMFQRKFHRWVKKLGKKRSNIAIGRSLLTVVYVKLKEDRPYEEPDPQQMHETKKAKLIRHHSKRLRQLGADEELINQMVAKLNATPPVCSPAGGEKQTELVAPPSPVVKTYPAKVCRGALGFRARQTRKQQYSVVKERAATTQLKARPSSKTSKSIHNQTPKLE